MGAIHRPCRPLVGFPQSLRAERLGGVAGYVVALMVAVSGVAADEPVPRSGRRLVDWLPGECLQSDSPCVAPGKFDLLLRDDETSGSANLILWTPVLKGGFGVVETDGGARTVYGGGYARLLGNDSNLGELIVGAAVVDVPGGTTFEVLAEHRLPSGLGVGAGHVSTVRARDEVTFVKLTFRTTIGSSGCIGAVLGQEVGSERSAGAYVALFDERWMGVAGYDGEQWRATIGFVAPERDGARFRPAFEGLFVDNGVGDRNGPTFLFVNGTLGFRGGFLSQPARLGRAMGPQGLEFGNPLGFLRPTWNRRLDPWELGGLASVRWARTDLPGHGLSQQVEAVVFPAQIRGSRGWFDGVFVGGFWSDAGATTSGIIAGYSGTVGCLLASGAVRWSLDPEELAVVVGLIDRF